MNLTREQILSFLEDEGIAVKEKKERGELLFNSPFRYDTKRRCGVNYKKNGLWNCYLSGEGSRSFFDFIKKIKEFNTRYEAKIFFIKHYLSSTQDLLEYFQDTVNDYEAPERSEITLDEDRYKKLTEANKQTLKEYFDYLNKRHINDELIYELKIFADVYDHRVMFPFYENGLLTFYTARSIHQNDFLPWDNAKSSRTGLIYNIENIEPGSVVYIFEAIFDCLMLHPRGIATLGRKLDSDHYEKILAKNPYKIVVVNDGDAPGQESQEETADKLSLVHKNVYVFNWLLFYHENKKYRNVKDFNELGLISRDIINKYTEKWNDKTKLRMKFLRKIGL